MKSKHKFFLCLTLAGIVACQPTENKEATEETPATVEVKKYSQTTDIPEGITTPNEVETSIGTLHFFDGAPTKETAEMAYDYLDRMRAVDVFLKCMPAASVRQLMLGPAEIGANAYNKVIIMDKLMDSKPIYLTGNTSTLYCIPSLNFMEVQEPIVLDVPAGMLGAFNDAWFRYLQDMGPFGPDKNQGGKYLVLPPNYEGKIPEGYYVVESPSYRVWVFMRGSVADGVEKEANRIKENLKIYPLSMKDNPPAMEFVSGSGKSFNTIHDNNINFYYHVNEVIQEEPYALIDPETRGLLAAIGIVKGREFNPDERMKKILTDAVAIGNAAARSIVWYPRVSGYIDNMADVRVFPDTESSWIYPWVGKNVFFMDKEGTTLNPDARVMFHYPYTAVTPAMASSIVGKGSDYGMAFVDADKNPFDGSKNYKLHLPPNPPANNFWAVTIYDTQTRSQLQTDQPFPTVGSQTEGMKMNEDGSYDIYFGPEAPKGFENNWLQTIPGKSWFPIFRVYGPTEEWIEKRWLPSEVEIIK